MKKIMFLLVAMMIVATMTAQEALWSGTQVKSPVVNDNGSVTFSIFAPQAKQVQVTGSFLPTKMVETPMGKFEQPGVADLQKDDKGVWTFTSGVLASELYTYNIIVDGMAMLDPANVYVNRDVASLTSLFIVKGEPGSKGDLYSVNDVPHGNLAKVWYDSPQLGMKRRMSIYTPPAYDEGKDYPVMYLLHGAGGDEDAWPTQGRTAQILDNLIASGKAVPMIVVMPNGNASCPAAPGEWWRGMYQPSFMESLNPATQPKASMDESFMDIVKYVESHYKVRADKAHRAVCGLSMGGGHSFHITKRFPDAFDYVGLFSAGLTIGGDQTKPFYDVLKSDESMQKQLAALFSAKPKLYWIGIGETDFLYQQNADLRRYLDEKGYKYEYRETDGGHIWRNWRIYLTEFAQKIFK
ncbi:MAG: esterase [Muribaculaceae bacterium]